MDFAISSRLQGTFPSGVFRPCPSEMVVAASFLRGSPFRLPGTQKALASILHTGTSCVPAASRRTVAEGAGVRCSRGQSAVPPPAPPPRLYSGQSQGGEQRCAWVSPPQSACARLRGSLPGVHPSLPQTSCVASGRLFSSLVFSEAGAAQISGALRSMSHS